MHRTRLCWLVVAVFQMVWPVWANAQEVKSGGDETITIRGFISATLFVDDQFFGLSNGQSAIWAELPELERDEFFHGGDVRNTRVGIDFTGPKVFDDWRAQGTLEIDFFGGFVGTGAFSDEQPLLRLRLAYADLTDGRTTVRIGQFWSPTFGYVPESLSHIAFPLGWGGGGLIGWRFPGIFVYHDFTPEHQTRFQLQLAALRGSWSDEFFPDNVSAGEATLAPQLEIRLDFSRRPDTGTPWEAYLAGHWDHKDLSGPGIDLLDDGFDGWAVSGGIRVRSSPLTFLAQGYIGHAVGQLFAQILQFGDFSSWGAQGQLGYDFDENWSVWAFYGVDNPDDDDDDVPLRFENQIVSAMLRYRLKQFAVGLEWFHAATNHRLPIIDERDERKVNGNQFALSVRYDF